MRCAVYLQLALTACSHPPPPAPPKAERAVSSVADLAGKWTASDETDFGYVLVIGTDGAFDLWIDRNHLGRCEEKGTLAGQTDKTFQLTYAVNDCHREQKGSTQALAVESFTGDAMTVALGAERRIYHRAQ